MQPLWSAVCTCPFWSLAFWMKSSTVMVSHDSFLVSCNSFPSDEVLIQPGSHSHIRWNHICCTWDLVFKILLIFLVFIQYLHVANTAWNFPYFSLHYVFSVVHFIVNLSFCINFTLHLFMLWLTLKYIFQEVLGAALGTMTA